MHELRGGASNPVAYAATSLGRRSKSMTTLDTLRYTKIPLNHGSGAMPAVGFGTLIPDPLATKQATKTALEVGFRHFDCAERYRNDPAAKKGARQGDQAAHANSSRVPLEAVGRTACRPDGANLPVSNASRNWQNYPHDDLAGLACAALYRAGDAQRACYSLCGPRLARYAGRADRRFGDKGGEKRNCPMP